MKFIFANDEKFNYLWDRFTKENSNVTWTYLLKRLEFYKYYSQNIRIKDLSFLIIHNKQILCICPLFLESNGCNNTFSYSGSYLRAPLFGEKLDNKYKKKIQNICYEKIDELAEEYSVDKAMFMLDILSNSHSYNILVKYGYLDSSINSCVLNLEQKKEDIWLDLRKSYKSLINSGKIKYRVVILDYKNNDRTIFDLHRKLHFKAAGRITRPMKTWDLQYEMIGDDNAILIGLSDADRYVAFSFLVHANGRTYYGNASDDPDYSTNIPLEHTIIWSAIEYYKKRNFKLLELGHQHFGWQVFSQPSKKDINISFFKRGFGGDINTLYRGIKYYNKEFMKNDLNSSINKMLKSVNI